MDKKAVFFLFLSVLAGLNLGTVRKTEDPIRDTQTNPILYEQKKEEEKGGKKGPLMYHVKNNPRESFFIDPPFEANKKSSIAGALPGEAPAPAETADWWEEQPAIPSSETVTPTDAVSELPPESAVAERESFEESVPEQPATTPDTENPESGKGDDYWW